MQAVTIKEAKARLNALIDAAAKGEQVVLMRGAKHVALLVPISSDDLEVSPRLTDGQAARLWKEIAAERSSGVALVARSPEAAVALLARGGPRSRKRR